MRLLGATLLLAILNAIWPTRFSWQIVAITGGIGLLQLVTAFISKPIRDLQQNLTNLAVFKMILESHSLKTALARFHLTTPHTLRELRSDRERDIATAQVEVLGQQVLAIQEFDTADFADLSKLARAIGAQPTDGPPQEARSERCRPKIEVDARRRSNLSDRTQSRRTRCRPGTAEGMLVPFPYEGRRSCRTGTKSGTHLDPSLDAAAMRDDLARQGGKAGSYRPKLAPPDQAPVVGTAVSAQHVIGDAQACAQVCASTSPVTAITCDPPAYDHGADVQRL